MNDEWLEAHAAATIHPDEREGRINGFLYGIVTDVGDPSKLGRVRGRIGSQPSTDSTDWLDPAWPGCIEAIPSVNDPIFVGFVDGDPHRGIYFWHPNSTTKGRATDFMLLGTTFVGMFNFMATQLNQLLSDYNSHTHQVAGTGTTCVNGGSWTGTATAAHPTSSTAANAQKGKASDGSVVANNSSSAVVLSGKVKIK